MLEAATGRIESAGLRLLDWQGTLDIITGDDKIIKNVPNFDVIDVHDGLIVGNLHAQLKIFLNIASVLW